MYPIGTRVTVTSVNDDSRPAAHKVIGRTGVVVEHDLGDDCPNVVRGVGRFERLLGLWQFADDELAPTGF